MMHNKRTWSVAKVDREKLIEALIHGNWCSCQGWECEGYLFLNDQTSPDGAGEWGVLKVDNISKQLESITFGWCEPDHVKQYVEEAIAGQYDDCDFGYIGVRREQLDYSPKHRCGLCA